MKGFLILGKFYCRNCAHNPGVLFRSEAIVVTEKNILPYSQRCNKCRKTIVQGIGSTEIFPCDPESSSLDEDDVKRYTEDLDHHHSVNDREAFQSVLWKFSVHLLRAFRDDKLLCEDLALEQFFRFADRELVE